MRTPARVAFGLMASVLLLVAPAALADDNVTATMSASGSFVQGTNVTYTIVITNNMAITQPDNPANEFRDPMPSALTFVSAEASSGTATYLTTIDSVGWDGSIPAGGSVTLTITASIDPAATGMISNQGQTFYDANNDGSNESSKVTDDPSTGTADDATSFLVLQSGIVSATKSVSGSFVPGTDVTYTIVMTNHMTATQSDNYSHEFTDVLPDDLTVVSVSATSGSIAHFDNIVLWDGTLAPDESVTMTVVATIGASASGTISNQGQTIFDRDGDNLHNESSQVTDDPSTEAEWDATSFTVIRPGAFEFSAANYDVSETTTSFDVTVNRTGGSDGAADVNYTIAAGTAQGADFAAGSGTLHFDDGETSKTFGVAIVDDAIDEPDQTIALSLSDPTNGTSLGAQSSATITIQDDDAPATLSIDDVTVTEGDSGLQQVNFTITKSGETEFTITVDVTPTSGTATCCGPGNDWGGPTSGLVFLPSTTTRTAPIGAWGDLVYEGDDTVFMDLSNAVNATIDDGHGVFTILNNDAPPQLSINDISVTEGNSGTSQATLTVTLVGATEKTATLDWTLDAGTATCCGNDFSGPSGSTSFPPGTTTRTISATIFGDTTYEPDETVLVNLTGATDATIADNQGVITIVNDDSADGLFVATKTITGGSFVPGSQVTWSVVLTNNTGHALTDNPGSEFTDAMPSGMTLDFASSDLGILGNPSLNVLTWDGALAAGQSANITIKGTISSSAVIGSTISNQATIAFDADGNGTNEQSDVTDDPATAAANDATSFTVLSPAGLFSATKSVSGTFVQGTNVTYTVTLTNNTGYMQNNNTIGPNPNEFTDVLPSSLALVSASASSGTAAANTGTNTVTWNGSIANGASVTITITATISATASGTISNQGTAAWDSEGNNRNDQTQLTDDPSTAAATDATSFNVIQSGVVSATKSVSGTFVQGTNVTYTIVMTNNMTVAQLDSYTHEFTDILPSGLTFVSASATSGTTGFCCGNVFFWDGSLAAGASVTMTVVATIGSTASGTISNQGQTIFDRNGDGVNEASELTDDPSTAAANDATSFTVIPYQADLSLAMTYLPSIIGKNENVTYTVVVSNGGPLTATNVVVTDDRPNDAIFQSVSTTQGSCTTADPVVCSVGTLANGASATITLVLKTPNDYSSLTNSATATSDIPDPTPASASASFTCTKSNGKPCK